MARKSNHNEKLNDKVLQFDDITPAQRKAAQGAAFTSVGNMVDRAADFLASGKGKPKEREAVEASQPYLKNKNVTVATAATNRRRMAEAAATDSVTRHEHENLPGAGWYFEHHRDLRNAAQATGFDTDRAITASAVMSPQNSPDNEKAAVSALMQAHTDGKVVMTSELHSHLLNKGIDVAAHHRGRMVSAHELSAEALAELSSADVRESVDHSGFDLKDVSRGGSKTNIAKAVRVLRGHVSTSEAISPHTSPKVRSYRDAIRDAVPDTAEHGEYMLRAADLGSKIRGEEAHGQQMFDLYGKRDSTEGMLSPRRTTAEDTWMNSISHGQPNVVVPGTRTNVMKTAGTVLGYSGRKKHDGVSAVPDPRIGATAVTHAANNAATVKAAKDIGKQYGVDGAVPSTLMQEVPWAQARRAGAKDPEFNQAIASANRAEKPDVASYARGKQFEQLEMKF